jgi:DNA processing protein
VSALRDERTVAKAVEVARTTLQRSDDAGVRALTVFDADYPAPLRRIRDAPPILYLKGNLVGREVDRAVACIGTRTPTTFGVRAARSVTHALATAGYSIVSGLALGIDSVCHEAALKAGGHTVAVVANGLDSVYPKSNTGLAKEILEAGGALVSEWPVGTRVFARNLVQRDRLQSGLSRGTVVFQTDVDGGSMHTVRFTLLQRRLLFAIHPTGSHATEAASRGAVALATKQGRELAELLKVPPRDEYFALLEALKAPPAVPVSQAKDAVEVLARLDARARAVEGQTNQLGLSLG